jgi:hypothetical protein
MIFYGVRSRFFDNDQITASVVKTNADRKPENSKASLPKYDQYIDWFETPKKAEQYCSSVLEEAAR